MAAHPEEPSDRVGLESDGRFPSGPWKGYFLQRPLAGRQWMELSLVFRQGSIRGDGRDWVGDFLIRGRYDVETGKCQWTKRYVGKHDIAYAGYNEGKGIWGNWEWPPLPSHRGGFHVWPASMSDPTISRLAESAHVAETVEYEDPATVSEPATASTPT